MRTHKGIGAVGLFGLLFLSPALRADGVYGLTSNGEFGTLNLATGAFSFIGNTGIPLCGTGLAEWNGSYYSAGCSSGSTAAAFWRRA